MRTQVAVLISLLALSGCGGSDDGTPPPAAPAPPPAAPPPPVVGAAGGSITEISGATVIFPAGAVSADTTFRIAVDSTGAPPVPAGMGGTGNIYVITPHGGEFTAPVEVRIPAPAVILQPNQEFKIAQAEPGGEWTILGDTEVVGGNLSAKVRGFSFFISVVMTYPLPIAQQVPYAVTSTLDCGPETCVDRVGPIRATFTVVGNGGQIPSSNDCTVSTVEISHGPGGSVATGNIGNPIALSGGTLTATVSHRFSRQHTWAVVRRCGAYRYVLAYTRSEWRSVPIYPAVAVMSMPPQLDVVEGTVANLDAILSGGAIEPGSSWSNPTRSPTVVDRATIDWERSDDAGSSWRVVSRSFQNEGNRDPFSLGQFDWRHWSVRHGFVASATDQGALIRARPCYTPPAPTAPSATNCIAGLATRIHVLQQSTLPAIVDAPRAMLVRTGQTANFSANASGLPAPTLEWQTRPANSTGAWAPVNSGSGATTPQYITAPLALSNNGEQYRVVATNAVGSTASTPVTVSVSDLEVAPSITTQPGNVSVTTGNDAVFAVVAHGTEALSYQWRLNGAPIAGANSPVLRLNGVAGADAGSYTVLVGNAAGTATSNAATLTVTAGTPPVIAPSIATQPAPVTVNAGNTATFAVGVNGTGPFTFQWRRDGLNMPGANSAVLTFTNVQLPNAGAFSVVVGNTAGAAVSSDALLTVAESNGALAPTITSQPSTLVVPTGGSGFLAVGATGSGPLSYQWRFNGTPIPSATLPVLNLTNVSNANVGDYSVTVTNSVTSTVSQAAQLILLGAPIITTNPAATTAAESQTATFTVTAEGSGLRYQWLINGSPIGGANSASYTTPMLVAANTGAIYSVMVYNGAGLVFSQSAVLSVQVVVAPSVSEQPVNLTVQPGGVPEICVAFGGTAPFQVWLQRWVNGAWENVGSAPFTTDNSRTCVYAMNLQAADSGAQFQLVARNLAGQVASNTITVTVATPPPSGTTLVSATLSGGVPDFASGKPSISADGRYVAFTALGINLIAGGTTNGTDSGHAYLRDRATGTTTLINRNASGGVSTHGVIDLKLSSNGRYAAFTSLAGDLVSDDTNGSQDVFRRDLLTGATVRLTVLPDGSQVEGPGNGAFDARLAISGDGRWVVFMSGHNLIGSGGDNDGYVLYARDVNSGVTRYAGGSPGASPVGNVAISDNGVWIAYTLNLVAPNPATIFLYDTEADAHSQAFSFAQTPSPAGLRTGIDISNNGRFVTFTLNSVALTGSSFDQVMVVDMQNSSTATLVSTGASGVGDGNSAYPRISGDGRYVTFTTIAPNLSAGQATPSRRYLVTRDLVGGTTTVASHRTNGADVWLSGTGQSHAFSRDGSSIAFVADHAEVAGGSLSGDQVFAALRP